MEPYEDLERFMDYWKHNPRGLAQFAGCALGRIAFRNYPDIFCHTGLSYFAFRNICERIDHLYAIPKPKPLGGEKGRLFREMLKISTRRHNGDNVICIYDRTGKHNYVRLMLLCYDIDGISHRSLRLFAEMEEEWKGGFLEEVWEKERGFPSFELVIDGGFLDGTFWSFRAPSDSLHGVIMYPESLGFFNMTETKSVADLIVLASNLTGF